MKMIFANIGEYKRAKQIIRTIDYWTSPENAEMKGKKLFYLHTTLGISPSMVNSHLRELWNELKKYEDTI